MASVTVRGVLRASVQYLSRGLSSLSTENAAVRSSVHKMMKTPNPFTTATTTRSFCLGARLHTVRVQQPAPDFKGTAVVDGKFKEITLSDFKDQYLVLFFYPLDFTFVCPTEIVSFSDRMDEFKAINTAVVGVSTDSHFCHLAWIRTSRKQAGLGCLTYPLLSDYNKTISRDYGVLIDDAGFALRGLFIIDPKGIVRQVTINDLPVGRSVDETLRLVKAYQYTDKHGEVCPANWNPETNPDTIKPTPEASQEYFKKAK